MTNALAERYEHLLAATKASPRWHRLPPPWAHCVQRTTGEINATSPWGFSALCCTSGVSNAGTDPDDLRDRTGLLCVSRWHPSTAPSQTLIYGIFFKLIARPANAETPAATWYVLGLVSRGFHRITNPCAAGMSFSASVTLPRLSSAKVGPWEALSRPNLGGHSWLHHRHILCLHDLSIACREYSLSLTLGTACLAAVSGAIAELFSNDRLDDNLLVPRRRLCDPLRWLVASGGSFFRPKSPQDPCRQGLMMRFSRYGSSVCSVGPAWASRKTPPSCSRSISRQAWSWIEG